MVSSVAMNRPSLALVFAVGALSTLSPAAAQTPPARPAVAFSGWRVVPSPGLNIVRGVFARNVGRFAACNPTGQYGTVSLRMATDANGQVASSTSRGTSFVAPNAGIASCVVAASRRLSFPGSVQGTLDIEVTVTLGTPDAGAPAAP